MIHPCLKRLAPLLISSLLSFLSLIFFFPLNTTPFSFRQILSKTLYFFSMDSLFFADDDDQLYDDRNSRPLQRLSDLADEPLYLVDHKWWSEAAVREDSITGVLYNTRLSVTREGLMEFDEMEISEIVLELSREMTVCKDEQSVSSREYALVSEWMFLRALKWYNDLRNFGSLAGEDNRHDLFCLQIRLLTSVDTNSLIVKIKQKDNEVRAFCKACSIFSVEAGLLRIWDLSGQTTKFLIHDRRLSSALNQYDAEILLDLQVYEMSFYTKQIEEREDEMEIEDCKNKGCLSGGLLTMNGSAGNMNSYIDMSRSKHTTKLYGTCELGLTGLHNLGNTCFMNSAIQCLVHTPQLVDYFLGDFRKDLNFENPLGMNGKLALAFGDLLRKLWALGAIPVAPREFKSTLAGFAPQFSGYNQHDSQEFLAFLLDGLHEDLNRVKSKPYIEIKDADGQPDDEVAEEHWRNHLARNNSIIVDVCQGQYRSTLLCPVCKKLSVTFDPFMYLSLPLPSTTMRRMTLTVWSNDGTTLPLPVTVTVPKYGRFKDLVQALSISCSLREDETLLVAEIYNNCILHFLDNPSDSIELIRDRDQLVAYRFAKDSEGSPLVVFTHQLSEISPVPKKFGIPLIARISDFSEGSELHEKFLELLNPFLIPEECSLDDFDDHQTDVNQDTEMGDFIAPRYDGNSNSETDDSLEDDDFQFYLEERGVLHERTKILMDKPVPISRSQPINVLVSWPEKMVKRYDTSLLSSLPEITGSALLTKRPKESVSLYKCLEAFLKEEPLGPEDMWYCPNCKKPRQASKKLDLWRLPEILVIHLKRFSYNRFLKDKLENFVDFPIEDFDLSSYIVQKNNESSHYMLYAVSNHFGVMGGGHYTAYVQCERDRWYEFDDDRVFPVSEDQIKTAAAYVLFYRKCKVYDGQIPEQKRESEEASYIG